MAGNVFSVIIRATWCLVVVHGDWFWLVTQQECCERVGGSDSSYFLGDVLFGGRR